MKHQLRPLCVAIFAAVFQQNAVAQAEAVLAPVIVTGDREEGYLKSTQTSATRMEWPTKETPLTIQIVDDEIIRDKLITKPSQLADVVAGVQQIVGYGNTPSQYYVIRGFSNAAVNYRDGFRSYEVYTPRDFANVDRVEFVKGPNSVLYGNAQPAGAVNTISKTPLNVDRNAASATAGSWSSFRTTGDFNKVLGDVQVRLNVAADQANSYVDYEKSNNYLVAPSIKLKLGNNSEILYAFEYLKTRIDGFSNGLPMDSSSFNLSSNATSSRPWAQLNNENATHRIEFKTLINEALTFRQGLYYSETKRDYRGVSPDGAIGSLALQYNAGEESQNNKVSQTELVWTSALGPASNKLLAGYEYAYSNFAYAFYSNAFISGLAGSFSAPTGTLSGIGTLGSATPNKSNANAVYLNDLVALGSWRFNLGIRRDDITTSSGTTSKNEEAVTGRFGVLYLLSPQSSVYYNAGQSFVPNLGTRYGGGVLDPERGLQHELGVKHSLKQGLELTAALFDIKKRNVKRDVTGSYEYLTDTEQQTQGAEFTLAGQINPGLKIIANASFMGRARVTSSSDSSVTVGTRLYGVANESFNLWGVQDVSSSLPGKLSVGVGAVHVGTRKASLSSSALDMPSYTRYDAGVFYRSGAVRYALNLQNLNNAKIFDSAEGAYLQRQAPLSVSFTAGITF